MSAAQLCESPILELDWEEPNDADPFDQLYRVLTVAYTSPSSAPPPPLPVRTTEEQLASRVADLLETRSDREHFGVVVQVLCEPELVGEGPCDVLVQEETYARIQDEADVETLERLGDWMNAVFDQTNGVPCARLSSSWA